MTERVFGEVGTRLVFENDRVRVWQVRLAPGERGPVHRHELDHLLIQVAGDRIAVVPESDSQGPYRHYLEADVVPGAVVHVEKGGVETAWNVGSQRYLEVVVELKEPSTASAGEHVERARPPRTGPASCRTDT